jgi:hypothetical protein
MPTPTPAAAKEAILAAAAVNLTLACAAMDISPTTGSRLIARGEFPVPIIRMGARVIVPTAPLRKALFIDDGEAGDAASGDAA